MLSVIRRGALPAAALFVLSLAVPQPSWAGPTGGTVNDCFGNAINTYSVINAADGTPKTGSAGGYTVYGTSGDDVIIGSSGPDDIYGQGGTDIICGGDGDDYLDDTASVAWGDYASMDGEKGDDALVGGDGGDILFGGKGDDMLIGRDGSDDLHGQEGADLLVGDDGLDTLHCGDLFDSHVGVWSWYNTSGDYADGGVESPYGIDPLSSATGCEDLINVP
jgi:Ca2+-binding RTX toxin-like protein